MVLPAQAGKPPIIWFGADTAKLLVNNLLFANGTPVGGSGAEFPDSTFRIQDDLDDTKEIAFQAAGITTATTRTITMPDANVNLGDIATNAANIALNSTSIATNITNIATNVANIASNDTDISTLQSGKADTDLNNLGTTSINTDLLFAGFGSDVGSDTVQVDRVYANTIFGKGSQPFAYRASTTTKYFFDTNETTPVTGTGSVFAWTNGFNQNESIGLTTQDQTGATNSGGIYIEAGGTVNGNAGEVVIAADVASGSGADGQVKIKTPFFVHESNDAGHYRTDDLMATVQTTTATPTATTLTKPSSNSDMYLVKVTIVAREDATHDGAAYVIYGLFSDNAGGTTSQVGSSNTIFSVEDNAAWDASLAVSASNIQVTVTGEASKTIDWTIRSEFVVND